MLTKIPFHCGFLDFCIDTGGFQSHLYQLASFRQYVVLIQVASKSSYQLVSSKPDSFFKPVGFVEKFVEKKRYPQLTIYKKSVIFALRFSVRLEQHNNGKFNNKS